MTKKKWIIIGGVVVLCLLLLLGLLLRKPGADAEPTGTTGAGSMDYTIQVCSESDVNLEDVGVYVYTDKNLTELVWFAKTDAEGEITFADVPSDNFVAVLADVPAGYLVEEYYPLTGAQTQIRLAAGLMEGDLSNITYKLGDLMLDFTVTASDGTEYKLSEILKEKKALILNYWYLQCAPCKSEFPYLQTAYEEYSEDVLLLALNPVNQDNAEIEQFRKENNYTFPMAAADPNWEKALTLTAYPTTVVIDRYGYISLIHSGSVTEEGLFEAIMEYYTADDYEQTTFRNLDDLQEEAGFEQTVGTEENPIEMGATSSFQVVVPPGHEMHYNFYRIVSTLYLSVRNENAYILYNGTRYEPTGGTISIPVVADDANSIVKVVFGNSGKETQTYTVTMAAPPGSMGNPFSLQIGDFTANVPAGSDQGIFYTFTPDMDGVFSVEVKQVTAGVKYGVSLTTVTPSGGSVQRNLEDSTTNADGNKVVAINAYNGTKIDVNIATLPVEGAYPAGTFKLTASLEEGTLDTNIKELKAYSVNVTDETGAPVSGVKLTMTVDEKPVALTTTDGVATTRQVVGTYPVELTVPRGFTAKTTKFQLTEKNPSASIKLDTIEKATYTLIITDSTTGLPVAGADVFLSDINGELLFADPIKTDANGKVELTTSKDTYNVSILKDGYISDAVQLTPEAKDAQVALVEGTDENTAVYTINAVDYFGSAVSGMRITFQQNGTIKAMADVIGGKAERRLLPGTYTIGVAGDYFTPGGEVTADIHTATVMMIPRATEVSDRVVNGIYVPELKLGANYIIPEPPITQNNYYVFLPQTPGRYQFTFLNSKLAASATIAESYQGSNPQYPQDLTASLNDPEMTKLGNSYDNRNNTFVVNIREQNLSDDGTSFIVGIRNAKDAVIIVTRIGDAMTDETDIVPDPYEATCKMDWKSTFQKNHKFTYIDPLTQTADDFTIVKDSNGYYHLNSVTGPMLYVNLGESAPHLALSDCMAVTDEDAVYLLIDVIYDDDGKPVARTSYNECLTDYVNARCTNTDVYPLNDDLILILQRASELKGWADYENDKSDYLFKDSVTNERIPGADPEITWMYAVCY